MQARSIRLLDRDQELQEARLTATLPVWQVRNQKKKKIRERDVPLEYDDMSALAYQFEGRVVEAEEGAQVDRSDYWCS